MSTPRNPLYIDVAAPAVASRPGPRPITTRPSSEVPHPHQQLTQMAPAELQDELAARAELLPAVELRASCVSVPGARALHLDADFGSGPAAAFQCGREFAHLHPADGSLHLTLPALVHDEVLATGWGEPHPISGTMLVFGPRNRFELEVIWQLVLTSYRYAVGLDEPQDAL